MKIIKLSANDIVELKKAHPCGSRQFTVVRVGGEVRIRCVGCGRDMTMEREKLERAIRNVITEKAGEAPSLKNLTKEGEIYE